MIILMARLCCLTQLGMLLMGVWLAKGTVRISLGGMVEDVKRTSVHWPCEPPSPVIARYVTYCNL